MVDTQHFCLRWNNYQSSITSAFENLRDDEDFVDVTLACDGKSLKAHRVVLSACSPYFRELLKSTPCKHPVIVLQDVAFADLHALVEFIYHGEVNVHERSLSSFLKTAEILRVSGLTQQNVSETRDSLNGNGHLSNSSTPRNTPSYHQSSTNLNQANHHQQQQQQQPSQQHYHHHQQPPPPQQLNHHHHHTSQLQQQQHHHAHQLHPNLFTRQQNSISLAEKLVEESMFTTSSAPNSPTSFTHTPSAKRASHSKRERRSPINPDSAICHDLIKKTKNQDLQLQQQQSSTINNNIIYNNNVPKLDRNSPQSQPTDFSPTRAATAASGSTGQKLGNSRDEVHNVLRSNSQSPSLNNNDEDVKMEPMELVCTTTTNNDYDTISNNNDSAADDDDDDHTGSVQNSMTKMNIDTTGGNSSRLIMNDGDANDIDRDGDADGDADDADVDGGEADGGEGDVEDDTKQAASTAAYLMAAAASASSSKLFQNISGSYNFSMAALAATEHSSPTNLTTNNNSSGNINSTSNSSGTGNGNGSGNGNGGDTNSLAPGSSQGLASSAMTSFLFGTTSAAAAAAAAAAVFNSKKVFSCQMCSKILCSKASLKRHIADKHAERQEEYRCMICERVYCSRNSLMTHIYTYHKSRPGIVYRMPPPTSGGINEPQECPYCHRTFSCYYSLKRHFQDKHEQSDTLYVCEFCHRRYRTKNSLTTHKSLQHRGSSGMLKRLLKTTAIKKVINQHHQQSFLPTSPTLSITATATLNTNSSPPGSPPLSSL